MLPIYNILKHYSLPVVTVLYFAYSSTVVAQPPAQDLLYEPLTGVTGNFSLVSDYIYRGVSRSDEKPAIQGGLDYKQPKGWFMGTWLSSGDKTSPLEIDLYGGYDYALSQDVDIIADLTGFIYPHASTDDSLEVSFAAKIHDTQLAYYYDFVLEQHYLELGANYAFTNTLSSDLRAGLRSRKENIKGRQSEVPVPPRDIQTWDVGFKLNYQMTPKSLLIADFVYQEVKGSNLAIGYTARFSL